MKFVFRRASDGMRASKKIVEVESLESLVELMRAEGHGLILDFEMTSFDAGFPRRQTGWVEIIVHDSYVE